MKHQQGGNGSGKIDIAHLDHGGWVVFRPITKEARNSAELPVALGWVMEHWFLQRPHIKPSSTTAILENGNTVEIHAFYEQVSWPPQEAQPEPPTD